MKRLEAGDDDVSALISQSPISSSLSYSHPLTQFNDIALFQKLIAL